MWRARLGEHCEAFNECVFADVRLCAEREGEGVAVMIRIGDVSEGAKTINAMKCLRLLTLGLFAGGACFAGANAFWNEFRASTGCGPDYSWPFAVATGVGAALGVFSSLFLFGLVSFYAPRGWAVVIVTTLFGGYFCWLGVDCFVTDYLRAYSPCDRKGDVTSFYIFFMTVAGFVLWLFIVVIIASVSALLPSSIKNYRETRLPEHKRRRFLAR